MNIASGNFAKRICRDADTNEKLPDETRFAGDHVYTKLQMEDEKLKKMTWQDFHMYMNNILQEHLPAQPFKLPSMASKRRKEPDH